MIEPSHCEFNAMMRLAPELQIQALSRHTTDTPITSQMLVDGKALGSPVAGAVLQAALLWQKQYVVLLTDGLDYEDMLNIHLMDAQLYLQDSARIGAPYGTGIFGQFEFSQPNIMHFRFPSVMQWRVTLHESSRLHLPLLSEPACVWRRLQIKRRFTVERVPD